MGTERIGDVLLSGAIFSRTFKKPPIPSNLVGRRYPILDQLPWCKKDLASQTPIYYLSDQERALTNRPRENQVLWILDGFDLVSAILLARVLTFPADSAQNATNDFRHLWKKIRIFHLSS